MKLQSAIDEFHETSVHQWALAAVSIVAAFGAMLAAAGANGRLWPAGLVIVAVLAPPAAIRADNHVALGLVAIIVWHWLATVDDVSTPWLPVAAVCLLVHHAAIALAATLPVGAELPRAVFVTWARRTAVVASATVALWAFAVVFDGRNADGNALLTALALSTAAGLALLIRSRSLDPRR